MLLWKKENSLAVCNVAIAGDYLPAGKLTVSGNSVWSSRAAALLPYFHDVQLAIANLECPVAVGASSARPKFGLGDTFSAPPEALEYLLSLGVRVVGLANNHIYDYAHAGLESTQKAIEQKGMIP